MARPAIIAGRYNPTRKSAMSQKTRKTAAKPAIPPKNRRMLAPKATTPPAAAVTKPQRRVKAAKTSKADTVLAALQQPTGASLTELMKVTGWQAHSVRGFLSGTVKKRLGLKLLSEAAADGRRYRTLPAARAASAKAA
jgi:hypothetical protein